MKIEVNVRKDKRRIKNPRRKKIVRLARVRQNEENKTRGEPSE